MALYDGFIFFNELDLLEIRLHHLYDVVDAFIICEAPLTFAGKPKPLFYEENKERFKFAKEKIIHIVADNLIPDTEDRWENEKRQRNAMMQVLKEFSPGDLIILGDADEIPKVPPILSAIFAPDLLPKLFIMRTSHGYVNRLGNFESGPTISFVRQVESVHAIRFYRYWLPTIHNSAWHFTYMCGAEAIRTKLESFAHKEFDHADFKNTDRIQGLLDRGYSIFGDHEMLETVPLTIDAFPRYLVEHQDRFSHLIAPVI